MVEWREFVDLVVSWAQIMGVVVLIFILKAAWNAFGYAMELITEINRKLGQIHEQLILQNTLEIERRNEARTR
jgi:hypothetical protein